MNEFRFNTLHVGEVLCIRAQLQNRIYFCNTRKLGVFWFERIVTQLGRRIGGN